jgi:hypothetical protein
MLDTWRAGSIMSLPSMRKRWGVIRHTGLRREDVCLHMRLGALQGTTLSTLPKFRLLRCHHPLRTDLYASPASNSKTMYLMLKMAPPDCIGSIAVHAASADVVGSRDGQVKSISR